MDNFAALRDATLGAQAIQAPASPLGASSAPELAKLYQSTFQLPTSNNATRAQAVNTGVTLDNQEMERQKKIQELKDQAQVIADAQDGKKFQQVKRADGGFGFYDGAGNEISAYDYANAIGKTPYEVLKASENPIDIGYQKDYKNLEDYISAKMNPRDEEAQTQAKSIEEQVREDYGIDISTMKIEEVINQFKAAYPTVYGGTNEGIPSGQNLIYPYSDSSGGL